MNSTRDGRLYADARLEAEQAIDYRRYASGQAANLFPGGLAALDRHPTQAENKQYLVIRCSHHFADEAYRSSAALDGQPYHGNYELQPADRVFRAPLVTPRPLVHGPQTAKVVARGKDADSEEIDTDPDGHGMIKVRFHWDRDDKRSCWISRGAALVRPRLGRAIHSAHRHGGGGRVSGGRSRQADRRRRRL